MALAAVCLRWTCAASRFVLIRVADYTVVILLLVSSAFFFAASSFCVAFDVGAIGVVLDSCVFCLFCRFLVRCIFTMCMFSPHLNLSFQSMFPSIFETKLVTWGQGHPRGVWGAEPPGEIYGARANHRGSGAPRLVIWG